MNQQLNNIINVTDMQLLRAISGCVADKNECRDYLQGIYLNPDKSEAAATDGSILLRGECIEQSDKPAIIVQLDKKIPVSAESGYFDLDNGNLLVYSQSGKRTVINYEILDGKFPNMDQVMPTKKAEHGPVTFSFNPLLMLAMLQNAKFADYEKHVIFTFQDKDNRESISFTLPGIKSRHQGVIMPWRI